ncbi:calcium sensing receptor, chloroplastic-like [Musa acuminata AAA Group]|uniref:calcium sensing receptor, chloroplastic-like n=1 Tax=Musa acuminata AAA Group TaxID=214697 RepID=UPI0031D156DF
MTVPCSGRNRQSPEDWEAPAALTVITRQISSSTQSSVRFFDNPPPHKRSGEEDLLLYRTQPTTRSPTVARTQSTRRPIEPTTTESVLKVRIDHTHSGSSRARGEGDEEEEEMAMVAFRAAAAASTSPRPPLSKPQHHQSKLLHPKQSLPLLPPPTPAALSFVAVLSAAVPGEARAFSFAKEDIVSSLTKAEDTIGQVVDVGSSVWGFSLDVFRSLSETLKPGVDAALPILQSASKEALKIASPVVSDASKQAKEALQSVGVDPSPVLTAAQTIADAAQQTTKIIEGAKPLASATVEKITSSSPSVVVVTAGALFVGYLLLPPIWSTISFNFRGYKGNLSPAQALDVITAQNYLMIDIRSEKDKNKAGVPRLPSNAKNKMISVPLEELPSKIKGLVRSSKKVEADIAALKISYLKKINKGSNIVIMDSYSDIAKLVARTLTSLGFKNCWIVTDGFSGGKGWLQSRLGTDSYNASLVEVLSPSRVIPAATARFGTISSTALQSTRKLLPGSVEN